MKRPIAFSDPYRDFTDPDDAAVLENIIRKCDDDITADELCWIFNGCLPAGIYEECLYFVDVAFERISEMLTKGKTCDSQLMWNLLDRVCFWIGMNWHALSKDGLSEQMQAWYCRFMDRLLALGQYDDVVAALLAEMNAWSNDKIGNAYLESKRMMLDKNRVFEILDETARNEEIFS